MNDVTRPPLPQDPDDVDDRYRRASAADRGGPSSAVRQAVLAHAAKLAAERKSGGNAFLSWLKGLSRGWSGPALVGTLAAAAFAGMMILPRMQMFHQARVSMETPKRVESQTAAPAAAQAGSLRDATSPAPALSKSAGANAAAPPPPAPAEVTVGAQRRRESQQDSPVAITAIDATAARTQDLAGAAAAPTRDSAARSSAAPSSAAASTAELAATQQAAGTDNKSSNALEEVVMTGSRITRDEVRRNSQFWRAAEKGDLANVQSLLSQGVLVNTRDSKGRTALLLAVQHRHPDIVNALLEKDADPNLPDNKGNTPLKAALDSRQTDLAETLRRHGAE